MRAVDERVAAVDERVATVAERVAAVDERVAAVDERVAAVDERVDAEQWVNECLRWIFYFYFTNNFLNERVAFMANNCNKPRVMSYTDLVVEVDVSATCE